MIINTSAIVLHRMKYKNSSLIARLFTKNEGKISIIVNGASKQKGNLFGVIEPPNIIKLNYYQKKSGTLQICKDAHFLSNHLSIKKDMLKLTIALSIVEMIDTTIHENDENSDIYDLADITLKMLNQSIIDSKLILSFFLFNMIRFLGFMPDLETNNNSFNEEIKSVLKELSKSSASNLIKTDSMNINYIPTILFFENYIQEHLKLNKRIQSLHVIRELING